MTINEQDTAKSLRSLSCGQYHRDVNHCELSAYLSGQGWQKWRTCWNAPNDLQVHHIFGRGGPAHEHRSNLIKVRAMAHAWGHDRHPNDFRMACLYAKWQKRLTLDGLLGSFEIRDESVANFDRREFDAEALSVLVGTEFVDWLEVQGSSLSKPYSDYAVEIIAWLRSIESSCLETSHATSK